MSFVNRMRSIDIDLVPNKSINLPLDQEINGSLLKWVDIVFGEEKNGNLSDSQLQHMDITLENTSNQQLVRKIPMSLFWSGDALTTGKYNRIYFEGEDFRLNMLKCFMSTNNSLQAGRITLIFGYVDNNL